MTSIFLSYAHDPSDVGTAVALATALETEGYVVFRDHDRDDGIPAGTRWANELFANVDRADVVVFLGSAVSLTRPWCHTELAVATARRRHVVQVQLVAPGTAAVGVHPVLADRQALPVAATVEALVADLTADLRRAGYPPSYRFSWREGSSPYPGMEHLSARHAAVLFGRDREIATMMDRLNRPGGGPVLVVGPSGSGKSSMVRAGVLPRLALQPGVVTPPPVEPGRAPVPRIAFELQRLEPALDVDRLVADPGALATAVDRLTAGGGRVVLCLDQAEQLLAAPRAEVSALVERLAAVDAERLGLVVVLRSASLDAWQRDELLARLTPGDPVAVPPLTRAGLREVITGPARVAGVEFESADLVEQMLDDTHDGLALPMLAGLLEELTRGHTRAAPVVVTRERYETLGPVRRVIERRAGEAVDELRSRLGMTEDTVVDAYLRLADVTPDLQVTRTEVEVDSLPPDVAAAIGVFERLNLVTQDRRGDTSGEAVEFVTPVHEEVFRAWPALAHAVETRGEDLLVRSWLRRDAHAWAATTDDAVGLAGRRLDQAADWLSRHPDDADDEVRRYVAAARRQHRRRRALTVATPILATVALVVGGFALVAVRQAHRADAASTRAEALRLAGESRSVALTRPDLSLLLALEAAARDDDPQVQAAPFVALTRGPGPRRYRYLPDGVQRAALDADGGRAVLVTSDGTLHWDLAANRAVARARGGGDLPTTVALSADGSTVAASTGTAVAVSAWGAGSPGSTCPVTGGEVELVRLSPRGDVLLAVAAAADGSGVSTVTVLASATCRTTSVAQFDASVRDADLDVAGARYVVGLERPGGGPGDPAPTVAVRQLATGRPFPGSADPAEADGGTVAVAFGDDTLGALGADGALRVWQLDAPEQPPWTAPGTVAQGVALRYLPALDEGRTGAPARWLAAEGGGGLQLVEEGATPGVTGGIAQTLQSVPAPGRTGRGLALALAVRPATATHGATVLTVDDASRAVTWSVDGAAALGDRVDAGGRIDAVAATADGSVVAGGPGGVRIVPPTGTARPVAGPVRVRTVAARGSVWAAGTDDGQVWSSTGGGGPTLVAGATPGGTGAVVGVAVLDDGSVAAVDARGQLTLLPSPVRGGTARTTDLSVPAQAMAGNGRRLFVVAGDGRLVLVDPVADAPAAGVRAHDNATAVAVSPDGRLLATGGDDRLIRLWDVTGATPVARGALVGHTEKVTSLSFSPDGHRLASGSEDGELRLWDVDRTEMLGTPVQAVVSGKPVVAFVADGTGEAGGAGGGDLAVAADGVARWPMAPIAWRRIAEEVLGDRTLTDAERQQYLRGSRSLARPARPA